MFNLPTKQDLIKPKHMSEKDWGLLFDAHMKRHDAFFSGLVAGFFGMFLLLIFINLVLMVLSR